MEPIGFAVVVTILFLPVLGGCVLAVVAPRYSWELSQLFLRWQYAEAPEPSRGALVYHRVVGVISLAASISVILWTYLA